VVDIEPGALLYAAAKLLAHFGRPVLLALVPFGRLGQCDLDGQHRDAGRVLRAQHVLQGIERGLEAVVGDQHARLLHAVRARRRSAQIDCLGLVGDRRQRVQAARVRDDLDVFQVGSPVGEALY
jgi:hypothetical protein